MLTAVLDTNVLVSAFTGGRVTTAIYTALKERTFQGLASHELLGELLAVLARPVFGLSVGELEQVRTFLLLHTTLIEPTAPVTICRDPSDNRVLECALAGRATHIVTGDQDLLVLHPYHGIDIVTPRVFLSLLPH